MRISRDTQACNKRPYDGNAHRSKSEQLHKTEPMWSGPSCAAARCSDHRRCKKTMAFQ